MCSRLTLELAFPILDRRSVAKPPIDAGRTSKLGAAKLGAARHHGTDSTRKTTREAIAEVTTIAEAEETGRANPKVQRNYAHRVNNLIERGGTVS